MSDEPTQSDQPTGPNQPAGNKASQDLALTSLSQALGTSFRLLKVMMLLVVGLFVFSGVFIVETYEKALVLRFGEVVREVDSGLGFAWPRPFESVVKVPTARVRSLELKDFWYKVGADGQASNAPETLAPQNDDGYAIAGDANILHTDITVHYRVGDAKAYYANIKDEGVLVRQVAKQAVVKAAAGMEIDAILRHSSLAYKDQIERYMIERFQSMNSGLVLERVDIQSAPPRQVQAEFDRVIQVEQQMSQTINKAKAYAEAKENEAIGEVAQIKAEAHAYAAERTAQARADANYINTIVGKYGANSEQLRLFVYDTRNARLRRILQDVQAKYFLPPAGDGSKQLRLLLGKDPNVDKKKENEVMP